MELGLVTVANGLDMKLGFITDLSPLELASRVALLVHEAVEVVRQSLDADLRFDIFFVLDGRIVSSVWNSVIHYCVLLPSVLSVDLTKINRFRSTHVQNKDSIDNIPHTASIFHAFRLHLYYNPKLLKGQNLLGLL